MASLAAVWQDEERLVIAARSGDHAAFDLLIAHHQLSLLGYLVYQTGDSDLALDLLQDTLLRAFSHLHQLKQDRAFSSWLYSIAINCLRAERRRSNLRKIISLTWLTENVTKPISALSIEAEDEAVHERALIQEVLGEMRPALRESLVLHTIAGFPAPEVVRILGISLAASERRVSRAKLDFRQRYLAQGGSLDARV